MNQPGTATDTAEASKRDRARLRNVAAATLGGVMAGHVLLETACDSLFLTHIAVDRLPWVTIAVALLAVLASRGRTTDGGRVALITLQLGAALGTAAFAVLADESRSWVYYASRSGPASSRA